MLPNLTRVLKRKRELSIVEGGLKAPRLIYPRSFYAPTTTYGTLALRPELALGPDNDVDMGTYHEEQPNTSMPTYLEPFRRSGMPRYSRRRFATGRSRYRRRSYGYSRGRPGWRGYSRINRRGVPELKYFDNHLQATPIKIGESAGTFSWGGANTNIFSRWNGTAQGGLLTCINAVGNGTGPQARIGIQMTLRSLYLLYDWRLPAPATAGTISPPNTVRLMIIWDRQPNGEQPLMTTIMKPFIHIVNDYVQPLSVRNLMFRDRFRVLFDDTRALDQGGDQMFYGEKFLRLNGHTNFTTSTAAATIDDIAAGAIYLLAVSDHKEEITGPTTDGQSTPWLEYTTRIRFTDDWNKIKVFEIPIRKFELFETSIRNSETFPLLRKTKYPITQEIDQSKSSYVFPSIKINFFPCKKYKKKCLPI